jgi:hypothetical protein
MHSCSPHVECYEQFLSNKDCSVNFNKDQALYNAAYIGNVDVIKYLCDKGANPNNGKVGALYIASMNGHLNAVEFLMVVTSEKKYYDAIVAASRAGHLNIVDRLYSDNMTKNTKSRCLTAASEGGHLDIVKYLFYKAINIRFNNDSALRAAIANYQTDVAQFLAKKSRFEFEEHENYIIARKSDENIIIMSPVEEKECDNISIAQESEQLIRDAMLSIAIKIVPMLVNPVIVDVEFIANILYNAYVKRCEITFKELVEKHLDTIKQMGEDIFADKLHQHFLTKVIMPKDQDRAVFTKYATEHIDNIVGEITYDLFKKLAKIDGIDNINEYFDSLRED